MLYKITSKVEANRLKDVLPDIISEGLCPKPTHHKQHHHSIECLHFMKKKHPRDSRCCALMLDMKISLWSRRVDVPEGNHVAPGFSLVVDRHGDEASDDNMFLYPA